MSITSLISWNGLTAIGTVIQEISKTGVFTYAAVILSHHGLSHLYSLWCNKTLWDSLIKGSTPLCRGILWGMSSTSDSMLAMWLIVGTSIVGKLSGIL